MGSLYIAVPHNTSAPFAPVPVATTTAAKTLLQVAIPSTTDAKVLGWGVSFAGVAAADPPGLVECIDTTASTLASVTSLTPDKWKSSTAQTSLCVGGAALTGYNGSAEGTITALKPIDIQYVHPQTGYSVWFSDIHPPGLDASHQIRIRVTFTVSINALPWVVWEEPS